MAGFMLLSVTLAAVQRMSCNCESWETRKQLWWVETLVGGWMAVDSFPRAARTNYRKLGVLKQQKFILQFWWLEIWSWGFGRAVLCLKALRENSTLHLPAFGGCWQSTVFLGQRMHHSNLCLHHPWFLPVCHCVSEFPLIRMPTIGFRTHVDPVWSHLNLHLNYICKTPFSK